MLKKIILSILLFGNTLNAYLFSDRDKAYYYICIDKVYGVKTETTPYEQRMIEELYYEMLGQIWFSKTITNAKNDPKSKGYEDITGLPRGILPKVCKNTLLKHSKEKNFSNAYSQEILNMIEKKK